MDVYHKVLVKLYEATGGRDTQTVDLKDLVKAQGFLGNYEDILQMLSGQGWIAETTKSNYVKITHWGVKEAQKSASAASSNISKNIESEANTADAKKAADHLIAQTKELLAVLEKFADDASKENFSRAENKIGELNSAISKLKNSV